MGKIYTLGLTIHKTIKDDMMRAVVIDVRAYTRFPMPIKEVQKVR